MMRQQRTLRHVIGCAGVGLHSGARVGLTLCPAAESSGIRFRRADRPGSPAIRADLDHVVGPDVVTSLRDGRGGGIRMIEHLMAALAACQIDNVLVEISGPEVPAMDGSAQPFVLLIECAGTVDQDGTGSAAGAAAPADRQFGRRPCPAGARDRARARPEARHRRRRAPVCLRLLAGRLQAASSWRPATVSAVRPRPARCTDEALRHAALDALGDLALIPGRLQARYTENGADPVLRRSLLRQLLSDPANCRLTGARRATPQLAYAS